MRNLRIKEYSDYLVIIQRSIFQILPLYEKENEHLKQYVSDLYNELDGVLDVIDPLPHAAWYFTSKSTLKILIDEVQLQNNHKSVKKKTLHLTGIIQKQIEELQGE